MDGALYRLFGQVQRAVIAPDHNRSALLVMVPAGTVRLSGGQAVELAPGFVGCRAAVPRGSENGVT